MVETTSSVWVVQCCGFRIEREREREKKYYSICRTYIVR